MQPGPTGLELCHAEEDSVSHRALLERTMDEVFWALTFHARVVGKVDRDARERPAMWGHVGGTHVSLVFLNTFFDIFSSLFPGITGG